MMESKLLELARVVVNGSPHSRDVNFQLLKNEVRRLDSQTTYTPQGESLEFAQPRKPMEYEA